MRKLFVLAAAACSLLAGCAADMKRMQESIDTQAEAMHKTRAGAFEGKASRAPAEDVIRKVSGSWLGGDAVASNRSKTLPSATRDFVYTFGDRANMSKIAERITLITGIPVRLAPDVFMPLQSLLASGQVQQPQQPIITQQPVQHQGLAGPQANPQHAIIGGAYGAGQQGPGYEATFQGPYMGSLGGFLDLVCARGLSWEYRDEALYISRFITRTFIYRAPTTKAKTNVSVGKSGAVSAGTSGGTGTANTASFDGTSKTEAGVESSAWESLAKDIEAVKTQPGKYSISRESNSVTITDIAEVVEKVGEIVEQRNRAARKQVNVTLEIINVTTSSTVDFGIDWTLVGQRLVSVAPEWSLTFSSPATLVPATAATLAYKILNGQGGADNPRSLSGSSAILKALNQIGNASAMLRTRRMAAHNQPTSFSLTDQGTYICGTTPAATTAGGTGGVPGITQCTFTVGYTLTLTPTVLDNGRVTLQVSFDFSELKKLDSQTSAGQLVQQPLITDLTDMLQAVEVKSGETYIMTALEKRIGNYDKRGISEGGSLGSFAGNTAVQSIVVLLTPVVIED